MSTNEDVSVLPATTTENAGLAVEHPTNEQQPEIETPKVFNFSASLRGDPDIKTSIEDSERIRVELARLKADAASDSSVDSKQISDMEEHKWVADFRVDLAHASFLTKTAESGKLMDVPPELLREEAGKMEEAKLRWVDKIFAATGDENQALRLAVDFSRFDEARQAVLTTLENQETEALRAEIHGRIQEKYYLFLTNRTTTGPIRNLDFMLAPEEDWQTASRKVDNQREDVGRRIETLEMMARGTSGKKPNPELEGFKSEQARLLEERKQMQVDLFLRKALTVQDLVAQGIAENASEECLQSLRSGLYDETNLTGAWDEKRDARMEREITKATRVLEEVMKRRFPKEPKSPTEELAEDRKEESLHESKEGEALRDLYKEKGIIESAKNTKLRLEDKLASLQDALAGGEERKEGSRLNAAGTKEKINQTQEELRLQEFQVAFKKAEIILEAAHDGRLETFDLESLWSARYDLETAAINGGRTYLQLINRGGTVGNYEYFGKNLVYLERAIGTLVAAEKEKAKPYELEKARREITDQNKGQYDVLVKGTSPDLVQGVQGLLAYLSAERPEKLKTEGEELELLARRLERVIGMGAEAENLHSRVSSRVYDHLNRLTEYWSNYAAIILTLPDNRFRGFNDESLALSKQSLVSAREEIVKAIEKEGVVSSSASHIADPTPLIIEDAIKRLDAVMAQKTERQRAREASNKQEKRDLAINQTVESILRDPKNGLIVIFNEDLDNLEKAGKTGGERRDLAPEEVTAVAGNLRKKLLSEEERLDSLSESEAGFGPNDVERIKELVRGQLRNAIKVELDRAQAAALKKIEQMRARVNELGI